MQEVKTGSLAHLIETGNVVDYAPNSGRRAAKLNQMFADSQLPKAKRRKLRPRNGYRSHFDQKSAAFSGQMKIDRLRRDTLKKQDNFLKNNCKRPEITEQEASLIDAAARLTE